MQSFRIADILEEPSYTRIKHRIQEPGKFRFHISKSEFTLDLHRIVNYENVLIKLVDDCLKEAIEDVHSKQMQVMKMGLKITSPNLHDPIFISWRSKDDISGQNILAKFAKIEQSSTTSSLLGAPFQLEISSRVEHIGGCSNDLVSELRREDGVYTNTVQDNSCLFTSAIMAFIGVNSSKDRNNSRLAKQLGDGKNRKMYFEGLVKHCGIKKKTSIYPLSYFAPMIESYFDKIRPEKSPHRLIVVTSRHLKDQWAYPINTEYKDAPKTNLVLMLKNNHYSTVWCHSKFFNVKNICFDCRTGTSRIHRHSVDCPVKCKNCGHKSNIVPCPKEDFEQYCVECNTSFYNQHCYEKHKEFICRRFKKCVKCSYRYNTEKKHVCEFRFCKKCKTNHDNKRGCFLTPLAHAKESPKYRLAVYDFETRQEKETLKGIAHEVNFCSLRIICEKCMDASCWQDQGCSSCKNPIKYWSHVEDQSVRPEAELLKFLKQETAPGTLTIAMGHYSSKFDIQLLIGEVYKETPNKKIDITAQGTKIYRMSIQGGGEYGEIRFLDSYHFIPMALDKMVEALGLPAHVEDKGFFPHAANILENYGKTIPLPCHNDYYAKSFKPAKYKKFIKWWNEQRANPETNKFNLESEIREYGMNDCELLTHAIVQYRKIVREINGEEFDDHLAKTCTLAGLVIRNLRTHHLQPKTVAIVPHKGYHQETQSPLALKYLKYLYNLYFLKHVAITASYFSILVPEDILWK